MFFFCVQEPADGCGGETPLAICREILSKLDPDVARKFEEKGMKYAGYWPDKSRAEYMSWQQQFYTDNREVFARTAITRFSKHYARARRIAWARTISTSGARANVLDKKNAYVLV